jgi:hypothetical protein
MLIAGILSLQTGHNEHVNGIIKCRRNKSKLLYIYILKCYIFIYFKFLVFNFVPPDLLRLGGRVSIMPHPCYGCDAKHKI